MENSTPKEKHMTPETFDKALDFSERMEEIAWKIMGLPKKMVFSGGECSESPHLVSFLEKAFARNMFVYMCTNGTWLSNKELRAAILRPEWDKKKLFVQVTNDKRFYPKDVEIEVIDDPRVHYTTKLTHLVKFGRMEGKKHYLPEKQTPSSFNIRSLTRSFRDVRLAIAEIRKRALVTFLGGQCAPSINEDGSFAPGENSICYRLGTVNSTPEQITKAIIEMPSCDRCHLESKLPQEYRRAIGVSKLYSPNE